MSTPGSTSASRPDQFPKSGFDVHTAATKRTSAGERTFCTRFRVLSVIIAAIRAIKAWPGNVEAINLLSERHFAAKDYEKDRVAPDGMIWKNWEGDVLPQTSSEDRWKDPNYKGEFSGVGEKDRKGPPHPAD